MDFVFLLTAADRYKNAKTNVYIFEKMFLSSSSPSSSFMIIIFNKIDNVTHSFIKLGKLHRKTFNIWWKYGFRVVERTHKRICSQIHHIYSFFSCRPQGWPAGLYFLWGGYLPFSKALKSITADDFRSWCLQPLPHCLWSAWRIRPCLSMMIGLHSHG